MSIEFLLGLLLAIPLSIAGNVLTPKFQDYVAKRSISTRGKRINTLINQYKYIKYVKNDSSRVIMTALTWIASTLYVFAIFALILMLAGVAILLIPHAEPPLSKILRDIFAVSLMASSVLVLLLVIRRANYTIDYLSRILYFREYEQKVLKRIENLGGNVEELLEDKTEKT